MRTQLQAIYENGVLRPLHPIALREQQRVTLTIEEDLGSAAGSGSLPAAPPGAELSAAESIQS